MLKFALLLAPVLYAFGAFQLSAWQTTRRMARNSSALADRRLLNLCGRLAEAAELDGFSTRIYEIGPINGLVTPDGQIYITRGLFNCYQRGDVSGEELSSVVAHELGHVALGHTRRRLSDFAGQNAARVALGFLLSRFIPVFGNIVAQSLMTLFMRHMSRADELAADAYASAILTKSGIGTEPQKQLLLKLPFLTGEAGDGIAWLLSHPKTPDRIKSIEEREARWNASVKPGTAGGGRGRRRSGNP